MREDPDGTVLAELRELVAGSAPRAERARRAAEVIRRAGAFHWVGLYDVTPSVIAVVAWSGPTAPAFPTFPRTKGLNGAAVESRAPVVSNDVANDPRYLTTLAQTGSEMIVPVIDGDGAVVGTVDVESPERGAFGPAEQALVTACAAALVPLWSGDARRSTQDAAT